MEEFLSNVFLDKLERDSVQGKLLSAGFNNVDDLKAFANANEIIEMVSLDYPQAVALYSKIKPKNAEVSLDFIQAHSQVSNGDNDAKNILILGEAGTGKSKLINSMLNFIHNKIYTDKSRYSLEYTDEPTYMLHEYYVQKLDRFPIAFIDSPGLTGNTQKDDKIIDDIKMLINIKYKTLHAICLVVKATQSRLSPGFVYSIKKIWNEFGERMMNNTFIFYTFSDGGEPLISNAIESLGIHAAGSFLVNNAGFFAASSNLMSKVNWEMSVKSFEEFFERLRTIDACEPEFSVSGT